jgi:gluconokinase
VIACSALKRSYRDYLRRGRPAVRIVILQADPGTLAARLAARRAHFFPARLLQSQLADLEMPGDTENTLVVSDAGRSAAAIADEIIRRLGLVDPPPG